MPGVHFSRYLASGNSYRSIGYSYRMGERTVSNIVKEVSQAIWNVMQPMYLPIPTEEQWKSIEIDYRENWQFPHCIGAIDGKHVVIKKPGKSGSSYFNYKHTFSIVLMVTVDAHYRFTTIDVGSQGRFSDGNIFSTSALWEKMLNHTLHIPAPIILLPIEEPMPFVFVGDEAFPLSENLMRPYPKRSADTYENKVFNYRLSRARQTVECAFGILASRFRIFRAPFEIKVGTVVGVVKAACVLHNYLRHHPLALSDDCNDEEMPQDQLLPLRTNNARSKQKSFTIRQNFTHYFNNVGSVPWQGKSVANGKY